MNALIVTLPLPPSLNNAYPSGKNGRRYASPELEAFKAGARLIAAATANKAGFIAPLKANYRLTLYLYFADKRSFGASDASNRIKAAEDAICAALGINDNRIMDVRAVKNGVCLDGAYCIAVLEIID